MKKYTVFATVSTTKVLDIEAESIAEALDKAANVTYTNTGIDMGDIEVRLDPDDLSYISAVRDPAFIKFISECWDDRIHSGACITEVQEAKDRAVILFGNVTEALALFEQHKLSEVGDE